MPGYYPPPPHMAYGYHYGMPAQQHLRQGALAPTGSGNDDNSKKDKYGYVPAANGGDNVSSPTEHV